MVITVSCPSCSTSFPVDSAKVPPKGVNARCSSCGDIFRVEKPGGGDTVRAVPRAAPAVPRAAPASKAAPPPSPRPPPPLPPLPPPPIMDETSDLGGIDIVPAAAQSKPAAPPRAKPAPRGAASTTTETVGSPGAPAAGGTFRFGKRDPTDKAKRLARVLVSDMIMYNAERHRSALENGTLSTDFEDEIEKSWKEYVEQVGAEIAEGEGRGFWREALNDILAKGESVF